MFKVVNLNKIKLKTKLIVLYIITIILPLLIVSQIVLKISTQKIISQTTGIVYESSLQTSRNIQVLLARYVDISDNICFSDSKLKSYLSVSNQFDIFDNIDAYEEYLGNFGFYDFKFKSNVTQLKIYFLNSTILGDSSTFIFADESIIESEVFRNALDANGLIAWGYNENGNIYLARTMKDEYNHILAVVSIEITEELLYSQIKESDPAEKVIIVADKAGHVVTSNNRKLNGMLINDKDYFTYAANNDAGIFEYEDNIRYKIIVQSIKEGKNLPDWKMLTMIPLDKIIEDGNKNRNVGFLICMISIVLSCVVFIFSLERITRRIKMLVDKMQIIKEGKFSTVNDTGPSDEIGVMTENFNLMVKSLEQLIYENYETKLQLKDITIKKYEAEFYALQSQINPHFLFNTMESIRMGLHNKGDSETSKVVLHLSMILRRSLYWEGDIVLLSEEIEFVKDYLEIQKYRFKDKISCEFDIPDELLKLKIPKLTIQPVVENAIKHGIEPKWGSGIIKLTVYTNENNAVISVTDNGVGMDGDILESIRKELVGVETYKKKGSIGLKNVNDRIVLHFGSGYGLKIHSVKDEGTSVKLELPIILD